MGAHVPLIESNPMLGLDLADALETAGLRIIGPSRRLGEAWSLLATLRVRGVVPRQERWNLAGRTVLRRPRRWGMPVAVQSAPPDAPGLAAALEDVPVLNRLARAEDVVGAVAPPLPARSGR